MADDLTMPNDQLAGRATDMPLLPHWLKTLMVLVGTPLVLATVAWMLLDFITRQDLERLLTEMKNQGWPTEMKDLCPGPVPDAENAALFYERAFSAFIPPAREELNDCFRRLAALEDWWALTREQRDELRALLERNARVIELVRQAAHMERCRFDIDYERGLELFDWRELLPLLSLERLAAFVCLADGHPEKAFDHWADTVAIVRHQERHNLESCEMGRLACLWRSLAVLEALVQNGELTGAQIARAVEALEDIEAKDSFLAGMNGTLISEKVWFEPEIYSQLGFDPPSDVLARLHNSWLGRPWRRYEWTIYLTVSKAWIERAELPYCARLPIPVEYVQACNRLTQTPILRGTRYIGSTPLEFFDEQVARVAAARTALALERYRLTHGDYPEALRSLTPEILPEVPVDPFDGEPMRYVKEDGRVAIYSIGENLQDDGGIEEPEGQGDIVFTLRRAPAATEESGDE